MSDICCCDNLDLLHSQPDGLVDLVYIDPPYQTGRQRRNRRSNHAFDDEWTDGLDGYLSFLRPRLAQMHRVLKASGTIYVHLDWRVVHHVRLMLDELFGCDNFLNEVIWSYRTGGVSRQWFGRKHDNILVYAKCKGSHTFHLLREGTFRTDGLNHDDQGRPFKSTRAGRLYFDSRGPAITDVWDLPFLSTVSLERCGYPAQKPLALLNRIIRASSNPGDLVADYFCGSGTTLVAARDCQRHYLGCDNNPDAVAIAQRRIEQTADPSATTDSADPSG